MIRTTRYQPLPIRNGLNCCGCRGFADVADDADDFPIFTSERPPNTDATTSNPAARKLGASTLNLSVTAFGDCGQPNFVFRFSLREECGEEGSDKKAHSPCLDV